MGYWPINNNIDILSNDKPAGIKAYSQGKQVTFGVGDTVTLLSYSGGPGYVSDIWQAIGGSADTAAKGYSTFTLTVDGVVVYSGRIDLFFAAFCTTETWTGPAAFDNPFFQNRGGMGSFVPIPFSTSISITVTNVGTAGQIWWQIGYHVGVPNIWPYTRKLKIATNIYQTIVKDAAATLVDVSGVPRGRLLGAYLFVDSWHGGPATSPATAPLEGAVKIYLDGTLVYVSSGTEDYFKAAGYFAYINAGMNVSPYITLQCKETYHWGAMRFHIPDIFRFNSALKVTWNCGNSAIVNFTNNPTLTWMVWYYTE